MVLIFITEFSAFAGCFLCAAIFIPLFDTPRPASKLTLPWQILHLDLVYVSCELAWVLITTSRTAFGFGTVRTICMDKYQQRPSYALARLSLNDRSPQIPAVEPRLPRPSALGRSLAKRMVNLVYQPFCKAFTKSTSRLAPLQCCFRTRSGFDPPICQLSFDRSQKKPDDKRRFGNIHKAC